jgi:hypothetical protein
VRKQTKFYRRFILVWLFSYQVLENFPTIQYGPLGVIPVVIIDRLYSACRALKLERSICHLYISAFGQIGLPFRRR